MADGHIVALPRSSSHLTLEPLPVGAVAESTVASAREPVVASAPEAVEGETLDRLGVGISLSCAVHCIATGLISLAPAAFGFEGTSELAWLEFLEWPFLLGAAVVGVGSLLPSFRHHHERRPLALFGVGMSLLAASRFAEGSLEIAITTVGVVTIATAHVLNLRACKH